MLEGKPDRVPLIELYVDNQVKSAFLGKPVQSLRDEVEFWVVAGYDYVPVSLGLLEVGGVLSGEAAKIKRARYSIYSEDPVEMKWAAEGKGVITSEPEFERFQWPTTEGLRFAQAQEIARFLPPEMGIIAILGKVFTAVWMLMGFETFALATVENPSLVERMFSKVGNLQYQALERALSLPNVTAAWMSDDIAYGTGLMVSPAVLRKHLFPWYKKMGRLCREKEVPFLYHSDGDLTEVLGDIVGAGFNALHPIEPKAMDSRALKQPVRGKLCLLGNVEVDRLARGTTEEVRQLARSNIRDLAYDGGYALGSSNSVTYYVPVENYRAMIETTFES
jgi:uroporphyrinogen decarboxylase